MSMLDLSLLAGCAIGFVVLERLWTLRRGQTIRRPGWLTDVLHILVGGAVIRLGLIGVAVGLSLFAVHAVPASWAGAVRAQPVWLQYLEVLITAELGIYASHRAAHAVPALWRLHAVHHSSRHLDWMSSHREHPVEQLIFSGVAMAPALVFGIEPLPLLIYGVTYHVHALLLHANVRLDLGPLAHVIGSPRFHHWHHADQAEAYDRNFAAQLPLLDHLFGTFRLPETGHPEVYGVSDPVPDDFLGQLLYPVQAGRRDHHHEPFLLPVGEGGPDRMKALPLEGEGLGWGGGTISKVAYGHTVPAFGVAVPHIQVTASTPSPALPPPGEGRRRPVRLTAFR